MSVEIADEASPKVGCLLDTSSFQLFHFKDTTSSISFELGGDLILDVVLVTKLQELVVYMGSWTVLVLLRSLGRCLRGW